jgi:alpha-beta hydrolase superfamily lysophospholipase
MIKTSLALAVATLTLACGSPYMPMRNALIDTHAPPDVDYANDKFITNDGLDLYEQRWTPSGNARATVVLIHGLKDHSSRYRALAVSLAEHGFAVRAYDMRGHGYSAGVRDHVVSANHCVSDLDRVVARVRLQSPDKGIFLLGQGFGGTIAGLYTVRNHPKLTGLILSAPALRGKVNWGERTSTSLAATFAPRTGKLATDFSRWTTDKGELEALRADPLIGPDEVTAGSARALLNASEELQKRVAEITVPLLVLDGEKDEVSDHQVIVALQTAAPVTDKKLIVYPGLTYDLFHETQRDQVTRDTVEWLQEHAFRPESPAPPPAPPPAPEPPKTKKRAR